MWTCLQTKEIISVLDGGGREYPLSVLVGELVNRVQEDSDEEARDKLVELLSAGDNAGRYIAYCSLKEMKSHHEALDGAILAFEENPANRYLLESWSDCSR